MPCLLLEDHNLVKTIKFKNTNYIGDPINVAKIYNEKEVDELIILDIKASTENKEPSYEIIRDIASECFMPLTYGGGIKNIENIKKIFSLGVEKIIINTHAVENPFFVKEISNLFGSQSIVISLDVKKTAFDKYEIFSYGGRKPSGIDPLLFAIEMERMGAGELFLNSIDRDGTMEGYDIPLIKKITGSITIPLIACGGAGKIDDFADAVKIGGASAVASGSMVVYQGRNRSVLINFPSPEELNSILG